MGLGLPQNAIFSYTSGFPNQPHQHYIKIQILHTHPPQPMNQKLWGLGSAIHVLRNPPGDSDACWSWRTTAPRCSTQGDQDLREQQRFYTATQGCQQPAVALRTAPGVPITTPVWDLLLSPGCCVWIPVGLGFESSPSIWPFFLSGLKHWFHRVQSDLWLTMHTLIWKLDISNLRSHFTDFLQSAPLLCIKVQPYESTNN